MTEAVNHGVSLMGQYNYAGAVEAFDAALALKPGVPDAQVNLAIALFNRGQKETGDLDRAARLLEDVLAREPNHLRALYVRGITLQHLGDAEASLAFFEKVVQVRPDDGAAWYLLGLSRQRAGQPAESALHRAIELKPYLSSAYYRLSQIAMLAGDTNQASQYLDTFKRLRESALNELIEVPQYGAMGELALAQPLPVPASGAVASRRYSLGPGRVLYESVAPLFRPPDLGSALPGASVGDLNHDGLDDLLFATSSEPAEGRVVVLLSTASGPWLEVTTSLGLDGVRQARASAVGDFDNDDLNDLLIVCSGTNLLFRGASNAPFLEVSGALPAASPVAADRRTGLFLDADHDGDLDLFVCSSGPQGARNQLFNNNADGTFNDLAATNGLARADTQTVCVLPGDLDGDRDLDLVLMQRGAPARLFFNNLSGNYVESGHEGPGVRGDLGAVLQDFDGNGTLDLVVLGGEPVQPAIHLGDGRGRFRLGPRLEEAGNTAKDGGPVTGLRAADFDLDGDLDLMLFGREGQLLLNDGSGRFVAQPRTWKAPNGTFLVGVEVVDLTGDLVPDLLCFEQGTTSRVALYPGRLTPSGTALAVRPTGLRGRDLRTRSPASGFGVGLAVRAGGLEQRLLYTGLNGSPNQSAVPAVFGLAGHAKADYLQLLWPDGVAQVESDLTAGKVHPVEEMQRKISSCPVLFAWNGERFEFITDFAGVGGLGYFVAPGVAAPPQVLEHVKIEPAQLRPRDGFYELRVTEPMEEAAYIDRLELWAVDHPAEAQVYPDERLAIGGPPPTQEWLLVQQRVFPVKALAPSGENCLDRFLEVDRRYGYEPVLDRRFIGFCEPHTLELEFGEALIAAALDDPPPGGARLPPSHPRSDPHPARPQPRPTTATTPTATTPTATAPTHEEHAVRPNRLFLFIRGFIEYPYSQTVYAASQAAVGWEPIRVDAAGPDGTWRTVVPDAGVPGGMDRMMAVDLTGLLPEDATRLRLTTNLEIGYDQVFVAGTIRLPRGRTAHEPGSVGGARLLPSHPNQDSGSARPQPRPTQSMAPITGWREGDPLPHTPNGLAAPAEVRVHQLPLANATLRRLGFPREVSPDGRQPLIYDYHELDPTAPFHVLRGGYTRYGAVEELLETFDDHYVIMGPGDEIALRFSADALPALPEGITRSFILVSHAWCKDMDLYTLEPQTLEPLPFRGMSRYPYPRTERYPDTPAHRAYHARYNTRTQ